MNSEIERLRSALAGRYEVEHELGRGGMAVVYRGRDLRLDRPVAIKVFDLEQRGEDERQRFLREIRVAARLQHPNILPVHESGEAEGLVFYVMPYVAGATLRERLEREGPLPVGDAVRIGREVAEALHHAHEAGIVHRDIKPDNIMLSGGVAVVADFGIARALEQGGSALTDAGLAVGTPNYMSPEQATAQPNVDGRADLYALGCVLYEMLAGSPPFSGPTAQAVMARHTVDVVPPIRTVRAEVPEALEAAVVKALAKMPADRWATGHELAEALGGTVHVHTPAVPDRRWRAVVVAAAVTVFATVAAFLGLVQWGPERARAEGAVAVRTIAVLPFASSLGDSAQTVLADGLTEGVSTGLVQVDGLGILSGGRSLSYRDREVDPQVAGRELGVGAVLTGSVRVSANRLRVTAQLTDVASGTALWRRQFDGELVVAGRLQDVFTIQDDITQRIVEALLPEVSAARRSTIGRGVRTRDPEAYALYSQAIRLLGDLARPSVERASALLEEALRRDSTYSDAWLALAEVADQYHGWDLITQAEAFARMRHAVTRAIELDSLNGAAYNARAWLRVWQDWDWDRALADARTALRMSPASVGVVNSYADVMYYAGSVDSALWYASRAVAMAPGDAWQWLHLATIHSLAGQADSAEAALERSATLDTTATDEWVRAHIHIHRGRRAEADREIRSFLRRFGTLAQGVGNAAILYLRAGDTVGARQMERQFAQLSDPRSSSAAQVRLAVGDRAGALAALEQAARERERLLPMTLPQLAPFLAGEPRFEAVRRQVFGDRPLPPTFFP
jgi:TolB-like protein/Tfp pilus assembly protein PilF/predicted Ser/Thr protein kinase